MVRVHIVAALGMQGNVRVVAALMDLVDDATLTSQPQELSTIRELSSCCGCCCRKKTNREVGR